jgi:predicted DsbA family dithiol-disulfide isomerase
VLDDADTLARLGQEIGLDPQDVRHVLATDAYADEVRQDLVEARELGINGVPFFVLDRRYGVSGAQPAEFFLEALHAAAAEADPVAGS